MQARYRQFHFGVTKIQVRQAEGGLQYLLADQALQPYAKSLTERLEYWAHETPMQTLFARRLPPQNGEPGQWHHISFAQALDHAARLGEAFLQRGLNAQKPVAILSENSLEHALVALGCLYAGIPFCPVSPAYSLVSKDYAKLKHVLDTLTPGLLFAQDQARYGQAIASVAAAGTETIYAGDDLNKLLKTEPTDRVIQAKNAIGPNTIAKFLFTSGSTKLPKAVVNTHGMWCANQQQMRQSMPILAEDPPVLVDWLPWNHTFGGNHNFGMVVYNGGTMFIDDGKPVPALIGETIRNLREIAPTAYFNVPTGFEAIALAMKTDAQLRENLLSKVRMFFYAGAALAQPIWDSLHETQEAQIGERIVMGTGLGMTESSPFGIFVTNPHVKAGYLGVPTPGLELKLVPIDGKTEVRYRGPNITPGYWRNAVATQESFDEEGFFKTGDAVLWIDPNDVHQGLKFDGRIAEDFKLSTGTFVSVGPLRSKIIAAGAPYVQDAVITGLNMSTVGALIFPTPAIRNLANLPSDAPLESVLQSTPVKNHFKKVLLDLTSQATGSATRVSRLVLLSEPPSIDKGEVTDKGSINQRAVLTHRASLVEQMYQDQLTNCISV